MALLRASLLQMRQPDDPKNWRPHILVLSGIPRKRWSLVELAHSFTHNRGLITVASVLPQGARDLAQKVGAKIFDRVEVLFIGNCSIPLSVLTGIVQPLNGCPNKAP